MKKFLIDFTPPVILRFFKGFLSPWKGDYATWDSALKNCSGYDSELVIQKVTESAIAVSKGEAVYERDSVLFNKIEYSWPLATAICFAAIKSHGVLRVLDFGGGLGSSFFQNKKIIDSIPDLKWFVVEQPKFVDIGQKNIINSKLYFEKNINDIAKKENLNLIIASSVFQYLEEPLKAMDNLINVGADVVLLDRLSIVESNRKILTKQTVPSKIYKASYPSWFFNKEEIIKKFSADYDLISEFDSFVLNENILNFKYKVKDIGLLFVRRTKSK